MTRLVMVFRCQRGRLRPGGQTEYQKNKRGSHGAGTKRYGPGRMAATSDGFTDTVTTSPYVSKLPRNPALGAR